MMRYALLPGFCGCFIKRGRDEHSQLQASWHSPDGLFCLIGLEDSSSAPGSPETSCGGASREWAGLWLSTLGLSPKDLALRRMPSLSCVKRTLLG